MIRKMTKTLLTLMLVLGVIVVGLWFYATWVLDQRLAVASETLRSMGGDMRYGNSWLTLDGEMQVEQVQLRWPDQAEPYRIAQLNLASDGWLGLARAALAARQRQLPEALRLRIQGLEVPPDSGWTLPGTGEFASAGCAERLMLNANDRRQMGYAPPELDGTLLYRFVGAGERLKLALELEWRQGYELHWELETTLSSAVRNPYALPGALMSATLDETRLVYQDRGLTERRLAFCAEATGRSREDYRQHHGQAWQAVWESDGFHVGPNLREAYQRFLMDPRTVELTMRPSRPFYMSQLVGTPTSAWLQALEPKLWVNRAPVEWQLTVQD